MGEDEMRVYIAGPMTGYEFYNVKAFEAAKDKWVVYGHEAQTPFDANSRVWERHHGRPFDPYVDECDYGDPILNEMFVEDIRTLAEADAIVLLEGWEKSKGANAELGVARCLGKSVWLNATMTEYKPLPLPPESALQEAQRLVHGNRGDDYGHPIHDFTRTAAIWSAILGMDVKPEHVALCMVGVKISRECNKPKRDNRVDGAGYFETLQMIYDYRDAAA
jgi:nucleoside 2-deoxyribosyltransferase